MKFHLNLSIVSSLNFESICNTTHWHFFPQNSAGSCMHQKEIKEALNNA